MTDHMYEAHRFVIDELRRAKEKSALLDIGCGGGIWAFLIKADLPEFAKTRTVGMDIDPARLAFCRYHRVYDDLVRADIRHLPFKDRSSRLTLACEILEHVPRESGEAFLKELDRVSDGDLIVSTPNGFLPTPDSSEFHKHYAGWTTRDLRRRGFSVRGFGSRLGNKLIGHFPRIAMGLHYILTPLAYVAPPVGGFLVARKMRRTGQH